MNKQLQHTMKRQRVREQEKEELKRHEKLWFDDGNVVLVSRDVAFRVHAGVLSRDSETFRDLLKTTKAGDEDDFEGCSTLHLSDTSEDLTALLSVLYVNCPWISPPYPAPMSRPSFGWEVGHHQRQCFNTIERRLPRRLRGLQAHCPSWQAFQDHHGTRHGQQPRSRIRMCSSRKPPRDALERRLAASHQWYQKPANHGALAWAFKPQACSLACVQWASCTDILRSLPKTAYGMGILSGEFALRFWDFEGVPLCALCLEMVRSKDTNARRRTWLQLPSLMGVTVDDWETE
ncbi:hypothetical protein B0H21DRAFT_38709 [Amylocystis lapponica]|nr:hypothetical protein B0H21DRAFT_38709 [Amylocystis lapponica]